MAFCLLLVATSSTTAAIAAPAEPITLREACVLFARAGDADRQLAVADRVPVERLDGRLRLALRAHFDECETLGVAGRPVFDQRHGHDCARLGEQFTYGILRSVKRKVPHVQFHIHASLLLELSARIKQSRQPIGRLTAKGALRTCYVVLIVPYSGTLHWRA